jgi:hypothetical protein
MKLNVQIGVSSADEGEEYVKWVKEAGIPGLEATFSGVATTKGSNVSDLCVVCLSMNTVQKVQKAGQVSAKAS